MRIIISVFVMICLVMSFGIWRVTLNTRALNESIKKAEKENASLKLEAGKISGYKDEEAMPLDKFYLKLFNDIKEVSFYYRTASEIKVIGSKDLVNMEEFFKPSRYRGIRHVDILYKVVLKDSSFMRLFEALYRVMENKPVEILGLQIENGTLSLTMRLYGP